MKTCCLAIILCWLACQPLCAQQKLTLPERWIYCSTNLLVEKNADDLIALFQRAAKAGYNGVLLTDYKFSFLADMPARYFANAARVKKVAADLHLEIIPAVFPIGYAGGLLYHDPNLVEGMPVRDALYVVKNGEAKLEADPPVAFKGGDFSDLAKWSWKDATVVADNGTAWVTDPKGQNARVNQKMTVRPFRQYHISVRIKTETFRGTPEIKVLVSKPDGLKILCEQGLGVKSTQDWTTHHITFNSLENEQVLIYFGCWDGRTGSLWWDDAQIEEAGLLNVVRRPGVPLVVKKEDGTVLQEGKDFEAVNDPRMGTVPFKGSYEIWHQPPSIKTKLPDSTRLRVSFTHAVILTDGKVTICPSESKTVEILRDEIKRLDKLWGANAYFMSHDEIRVLNQDDACRNRHLDAGAILADNVKTCCKRIREVKPEARIYVWSDMFDPFHNAHKDYYLVNGDLTGSWEGLDKDVIIVPWYLGMREKSLKFFADRGHRQLIAGYYDGPTTHARDWLDAAKQVKGITGIMFTTWLNNYNDLEKYQQVVDEWLGRQ